MSLLGTKPRDPQGIAAQNFLMNHIHGGSPGEELPAYMGATPDPVAYGPGIDFKTQLTEADRQKYISQLVKSLPPKTGELYKRMTKPYHIAPVGK